MTVTRLMTRPCTLTLRYASAEVNRYGDTITDEAIVETLCELQQQNRSSDENVAADEWRLYLPAATVPQDGDTADVDGMTFEVIGEPWQVRSPVTNRVSHVEATVRRAHARDDQTEGS